MCLLSFLSKIVETITWNMVETLVAHMIWIQFTFTLNLDYFSQFYFKTVYIYVCVIFFRNNFLHFCIYYESAKLILFTPIAKSEHLIALGLFSQTSSCPSFTNISRLTNVRHTSKLASIFSLLWRNSYFGASAIHWNYVDMHNDDR